MLGGAPDHRRTRVVLGSVGAQNPDVRAPAGGMLIRIIRQVRRSCAASHC